MLLRIVMGEEKRGPIFLVRKCTAWYTKRQPTHNHRQMFANTHTRTRTLTGTPHNAVTHHSLSLLHRTDRSHNRPSLLLLPLLLRTRTGHTAVTTDLIPGVTAGIAPQPSCSSTATLPCSSHCLILYLQAFRWRHEE